MNNFRVTNSGAISATLVFRRESVTFRVKIGITSQSSLSFEEDSRQKDHFDCSLNSVAVVLRRRLVFYLAP